MAPSAENNNNIKIRSRITLAASILLGLIFVISGSGKLFGFGEIPGHTVEFIGLIVPDALLTPGFVHFVYSILIPHILPWLEFLLGILLLIGFLPRIMAIFCILLAALFIGNNSWAISQGMDKYASCECFGIWEEIFGGLTPLQSLGVDIGLFVLALIIIVLYPASFVTSRQWLDNLGKRFSRNKAEKHESE
jgi:uncharacterized membrane protein YphA (DoxX/SURF4 family)